MKKILKKTSLILAAVAIFSSCKKNDQIKSDSEIITKGNNLSIGDGKWDVLSYGYDVTGDFLNPNNLSDAPILDMKRFETDYLQRIDVGTGSMGTDSAYFGSSAIDYLKEVSKKRAYGFEATYGQKESKDSNRIFFSGTYNKVKQDETKTSYYSKYSYASYESYRAVKRIRFTGDAPVSLLMNYLTPEFINNVATKDANYLVARYGTHVLLDITLGGRLKFDYGAAITNQSDYTKKVRNTKVGITGFLRKIGINLSADVTNEEITKVLTESSSKQFAVTYFGGTNSGLSMTADANGNFSQSINLASWQQSVTDRNSQLVEIGKAVRLSDFITDPVKKSQVNAAIEKHIADSQIKELGEVPVFQFYFDHGQDYILSLKTNPIDPIYPGWESQGTSFYGFNSAVHGAVPIYEFRNHQLSRTIYSSNKNTVSPVWPGWSTPSIVFYAYANGGIPGTVPVYEFYHAQNECNLYSTDINSVNGYPGWSRLGIVFYVFPR